MDDVWDMVRLMNDGTVKKHSEQVRQAVRWISEQRKIKPDKPLGLLLSEAGPRFNLSPKEQEGLFALLTDDSDTDT